MLFNTSITTYVENVLYFEYFLTLREIQHTVGPLGAIMRAADVLPCWILNLGGSLGCCNTSSSCLTFVLTLFSNQYWDQINLYPSSKDCPEWTRPMSRCVAERGFRKTPSPPQRWRRLLLTTDKMDNKDFSGQARALEFRVKPMPLLHVARRGKGVTGSCAEGAGEIIVHLCRLFFLRYPCPARPPLVPRGWLTSFNIGCVAGLFRSGMWPAGRKIAEMFL